VNIQPCFRTSRSALTSNPVEVAIEAMRISRFADNLQAEFDNLKRPLDQIRR
jgi:hypothetical protein